MTQDVSDFEAEVLAQVYEGTSKVPELVEKLDVRYNILMRAVNRLVEKELLEISTYQEGLFGEYERVHLTGEGRQVAKRLRKEHEPISDEKRSSSDRRDVQREEKEPETPRVQQQVKVSSGLQVCGYVCLLMFVIFIILLAVGGVFFRDWLCTFPILGPLLHMC